MIMFGTYVILKVKLYDLQPQHILLFGLIWDDKCSVIYLKKSNTIPFPSKYFKVLSVPWTCLSKKTSSTYNIQKQLFQVNGMSKGCWNLVKCFTRTVHETSIMLSLCSLKLITKCVNGFHFTVFSLQFMNHWDKQYAMTDMNNSLTINNIIVASP